MNITSLYKASLLSLCISAGSSVTAQPLKVLSIDSKAAGVAVQPTMWGVFFEDINLGADGGLYAEMIKNRSFEFDTPFMGWSEMKELRGKGAYLVHNTGSIERKANRHYVRLEATESSGYGIVNEGFRGLGLKKDMQYNFSVKARQVGVSKVGLRVELLDDTGQLLGSAEIQPAGNEWTEYKATLSSKATVMKARVQVRLTGPGIVDLDMLSLFPQDTWKQRPGGLRADMVQLLADMKPGFLRFPGGCIVEGRTLDERFQWKKTIGKPEDRELIINRWNVEFKHRLTPDYFQSFGLGFFEYFQLAEDIGAEALPILNCGMACQYNTGEVVPMDQLDPYIQDALDLIEFANGPADSPWGRRRAEMGHPAPFNMKMLGVGNENWGPQYIERVKAFTKVLKERYPEIKLVNSGGTDPDGAKFEFLNGALRVMDADIIDEHYYRPPAWFFANAGRYDNYKRGNTKVFAGEYAAQSKTIASSENRNTWYCALSEAAFMTGLERNADVVTMASYAPLFAHADGWQWTPDMIWVNNLKAYGTPNYQVQKLFSLNKGTRTVPLLSDGRPLEGQDSLYASAVLDERKKVLIMKLVNGGGVSQRVSLQVKGTRAGTRYTQTVLSAAPEALNSFDNPEQVSPVSQELRATGPAMNVTLKPYSFNVISVPI